MKKIIFVLLCSVSVLMGGCANSLIPYQNPTYSKEVFETQSEIKEISLNEYDIPIQIQKSDESRIRVEYYNADNGNERYDIQEKDGQLSVKKIIRDENVHILQNQEDWEELNKLRLSVFLPEDYNGDLYITSKDADIEIGAIQIRTLEIETAEGNVNLDYTRISKAMTCTTAEGNIKGNMGDEWEGYQISTKTVDGDTNLEDSFGGNKTMKLKTMDGDIHLLFSE